jgi:hypothetical protein
MNPARPPNLTVKGFGGEFYRRGNARQQGAVTTDRAALTEQFLTFQQKHDALKVLRPDEVDHQREWFRAWIDQTAEQVRFDLLPEKLYVDFRLTHWTGILTQATPLIVKVNPLLSPLATRKNMELSSEARSAERFHFEVMRRAAPHLVAVPFLDQTWHPDILAEHPDLPRDPYPVTVKPRVARNWSNPGWSLLGNEQRAIEKLFHAALHKTALDEVCDVRRLKRLARRSETISGGASVKEMFSCIGVSLALLGRIDPVVDDPPPLASLEHP